MKTFEKIYNVVAKIPKGKVATYKQISEIIGIRNPRIVGFALNSNKDPKNIPCHRVVSVSGKLTGYAFGGIIKKAEMLKKEGVVFLNSETIDLTKSLFM